MQRAAFDNFFTGIAFSHLLRAIRDALDEDGPDLTTNAVFREDAVVVAQVVAKQEAVLAGVYIAPMVLDECARLEPGKWTCSRMMGDGSRVHSGDVILHMKGSPRILLRAERVILNFITHLSGIATLTRLYVDALAGTGARLLDTRKTLPGLRYPEKYAVLIGGGCNHRKNLAEMLMLKDNHVDAAGGIFPAVERLRAAYDPAPPIEVECRNLEEVREAVLCGVSRIMLDNMVADGEEEMMSEALNLIPRHIEVEISGGVNLGNIALAAVSGGARQPDFISVGRLTHSAPSADFSMRITHM